jgi:hypothetical protein
MTDLPGEGPITEDEAKGKTPEPSAVPDQPVEEPLGEPTTEAPDAPVAEPPDEGEEDDDEEEHQDQQAG